ncbi:hypothetical protein [Klebsiella variicola]|uniref:hypothetical protein n=1 Tax=Klebsiella variicola TaxID=244366 RepID=UPI0034DDF60A
MKKIVLCALALISFSASAVDFNMMCKNSVTGKYYQVGWSTESANEAKKDVAKKNHLTLNDDLSITGDEYNWAFSCVDDVITTSVIQSPAFIEKQKEKEEQAEQQLTQWRQREAAIEQQETIDIENAKDEKFNQAILWIVVFSVATAVFFGFCRKMNKNTKATEKKKQNEEDMNPKMWFSCVHDFVNGIDCSHVVLMAGEGALIDDVFFTEKRISSSVKFYFSEELKRGFYLEQANGVYNIGLDIANGTLNEVVGILYATQSAVIVSMADFLAAMAKAAREEIEQQKTIIVQREKAVQRAKAEGEAERHNAEAAHRASVIAKMKGVM